MKAYTNKNYKMEITYFNDVLYNNKTYENHNV